MAAALGVLVVAASGWILIVLLDGRNSGWYHCAQRLRRKGIVQPAVSRKEIVRVASYHGIWGLVEALPQGLRLSASVLTRPMHPPIFVPWELVRVGEDGFFGPFGSIHILLDDDFSIPLGRRAFRRIRPFLHLANAGESPETPCDEPGVKEGHDTLPGSARILRTLLAVALGLSVLVAISSSAGRVYLRWQYVDSMPSSPQSDSGRTNPVREHEFLVFVNDEEINRYETLSTVSTLSWSGFLLLVTAWMLQARAGRR